MVTKKTKIRYVEVNAKSGNFVSRFINSKKEIDLSDIKLLRSLFSNEKSKILYILKNKNPKSIYSLAKILKRDLKSVRNDVKMLERFGFIEFVSEKKGKRESLMPVLAVDRIQINVDV